MTTDAMSTEVWTTEPVSPVAPDCKSTCYNNTDVDCYTDTYGDGQCRWGYYLTDTDSFNIPTELPVVGSCRLCSLNITNCCQCNFDPSNTTLLKCITCATGHDVRNDVTCEVTTSHIPGWLIAVIVIVVLVGILCLAVFIVLIKRSGCLRRLVSFARPLLPTGSQLSKVDDPAAVNPTSSHPTSYGPRYTSEPKRQGLPLAVNTRGENIKFRNAAVSSQVSPETDSRTSDRVEVDNEADEIYDDIPDSGLDPNYADSSSEEVIEAIYVDDATETSSRTSGRPLTGLDPSNGYSADTRSSGLKERTKQVQSEQEQLQNTSRVQSVRDSSKSQRPVSIMPPALAKSPTSIAFMSNPMLNRLAYAQTPASAASALELPRPRVDQLVTGRTSHALPGPRVDHSVTEDDEIYENVEPANLPAHVDENAEPANLPVHVAEDDYPEEDYENLSDYENMPEQLQKPSRYHYPHQQQQQQHQQQQQQQQQQSASVVEDEGIYANE